MSKWPYYDARINGTNWNKTACKLLLLASQRDSIRLSVWSLSISKISRKHVSCLLSIDFALLFHRELFVARPYFNSLTLKSRALPRGRALSVCGSLIRYEGNCKKSTFNKDLRWWACYLRFFNASLLCTARFWITFGWKAYFFLGTLLAFCLMLASQSLKRDKLRFFMVRNARFP